MRKKQDEKEEQSKEELEGSLSDFEEAWRKEKYEQK